MASGSGLTIDGQRLASQGEKVSIIICMREGGEVPGKGFFGLGMAGGVGEWESGNGK